MFINQVFIDWNKISEQSYIRRIETIRNLECLKFSKAVTFFVGENGSGKSTLLEAMAIADGFNPEGGTRNYDFSTYDSHSELCEAIKFSRSLKAKWGYFLRAESFYNVATMEEEYSKGPGGKPMHYHEKSHGESFFAMIQNSFRENGIYFLDEPEAALSPQRQLSLIVEIDKFRKLGAQFFIVTHSPILLGLPDSDILSFDEGQIHRCDYEETDTYKITSLFLKDKENVLRKLLE